MSTYIELHKCNNINLTERNAFDRLHTNNEKNQKPKIQTPKHLNVEKDYCQESI